MKKKPNKGYRRRRYLIDERIQTRFLLLVIGILFLVIFASGTTSYLLLADVIEKNIYSPHLSAEKFDQLIRKRLILINLAFFLSSASLLFIAALFYVNRLKGSLDRFIRHIETMKQGRLPGPIFFRKGDPLQEIANHFNQAIESLCIRFQKANSNISLAMDKLEGVFERRGDESVARQLLSDTADLLEKAAEELPSQKEVL